MCKQKKLVVVCAVRGVCCLLHGHIYIFFKYFYLSRNFSPSIAMEEGLALKLFDLYELGGHLWPTLLHTFMFSYFSKQDSLLFLS